MKEIFTRDEKGNIQIKHSNTWDVYESIFDSCDTGKEVKDVLMHLTTVSELVSDIRETEIKNQKVGM